MPHVQFAETPNPAFFWDLFLRWMGRNFHGCGNRGTRVLDFGKNKQTKQNLREMEQMMECSVFSCRAATEVRTFPIGTHVFPRSQHPAKPIGIRRRPEWWIQSALLPVWSPSECCQIKMVSSWQEISYCLKPLTLRKRETYKLHVLAEVREELLGKVQRKVTAKSLTLSRPVICLKHVNR